VAGVKGKSGGARPGAGRPRARPELVDVRPRDGSRSFRSPMEFLMAVVDDARVDLKTRVDAAKALLPFKHQRQGEARQDQISLGLEADDGDGWDGLLQ
jgi:phage terminase small subunit